MIGLGTSLRCNLPPRHIWVVLSDPSANAGEILMVNLTTLRDRSVDEACILGPADYSLLTHRSTVAYSRSESGKADALQQSVERGGFRIISPVPPATLAKIIEGARNSPELSPAKKKLLPPAT
ncbi:MAG: hypothetical protein NTW86_04405 [Candidatus Sumerlaeota bacterium]|nr:hypothetical protein [Candidatus Sumerlaeota bacterium]